LTSTSSKEYIQKTKVTEDKKEQYQAPTTPTKEESPSKPKLTFSTDEMTGTPKSALKGSSGSTVRKEVSIQIQEPGSKAQLDKKTEMLLEEYWSSGDSVEAAQCIEDLNSTDYYPDLVTKAVLLSLEKKDRERQDLVSLFKELNEKSLLSAEDYSKGFANVVESLEDIEPDIPFASKYVASFVGSSMAFEKPLPWTFLEDSLDSLPPGKILKNVQFDLIVSGKSANFAVSVLSAYKSQLGVTHNLEL
jgi:hypothetical protein